MLTLTEHASVARPADTYGAQFHGNGISSRCAFSQRTVLRGLILLLHQLNYQLPSLARSAGRGLVAETNERARSFTSVRGAYSLEVPRFVRIARTFLTSLDFPALASSNARVCFH